MMISFEIEALQLVLVLFAKISTKIKAQETFIHIHSIEIWNSTWYKQYLSDDKLIKLLHKTQENIVLF